MLRQIFPKPGRRGHGDTATHWVPTFPARAGTDCRGCSLRRRRSAAGDVPFDRPCVALMMSIIENVPL